MTCLEELEWRIRETEEILQVAQEMLKAEPDRPSVQANYNSLKKRLERLHEKVADHELNGKGHRS